MATIYRVRLATADELLARKYGEHFYTEYANAARKQEQLIREMTQLCGFQKRGVKDVHEETDRCFALLHETDTRRRLVGTATRLEDGSFGTCEYLVSTPWVEFAAISTEDEEV